MSAGTLIGVGLGPGDPELVTLKAARLLATTSIVAFFCKKGHRGHARTIASGLIARECQELALEYPITTEISPHRAEYVERLAPFYENAAAAIADHLLVGRDVALLCEGDPLFYGSFMHMFVRLRSRFPVEIVAGVTGMSGCWTAAQTPMTWGDDGLVVLPGTLPAEVLLARLCASEAAVIMKIGSNFSKVRAALAAAGRLRDAIYVERGTMVGETVMPLCEKVDGEAPYFSIILVPGHGRRP